MAMSYPEALERALEAAQTGEPMDEVVAAVPPKAARLRDDVGLAEAVSRFSTVLPRPSDAARSEASARLMAHLHSPGSIGREPSPSPLPWFRSWAPDLSRFGLAGAALLVAAIVTFALIGYGGDGGAEAAVLEGVVLDKDAGTITLQTLDALEEIVVPADTPASDIGGASIDLDGIAVGEVVVVKARRKGGSLTARSIERIEPSIDRWCSFDADRCRPVTNRLEDFHRRCQAGDEVACRRLAIVCERNPGVCPVDPPRPVPPPIIDGWPEQTPTARPPAEAGPMNAPPLRVPAEIATPVGDAPPAGPTSPPTTRPPEPFATRARDVIPVRPTSTPGLRVAEPTPTPARFGPQVRPTSTQQPRASEPSSQERESSLPSHSSSAGPASTR